MLGKGDLVVFCEVKTRTDGAFGAGREAVNDKKRERYVKIASYYLAERGLSDAQVRFDVVEVQGGAPEHIENAFFA